VRLHRLVEEALHVHAHSHRLAGGVQFGCHLVGLEGFLGKHGAGFFLPIGGRLPLLVELFLLGLDVFFETWQVLGSEIPFLAQKQALEDGLHHLFGIQGDGHGNAQGVADGAMLAQQHIQNDAVGAVIDPVIGEDAHLRLGLPEAVHTALALLVPGGVPGKVVMHDGVEVILEIDALAEAIGGDEHPAACTSQFLDARLALGRWQIAGHSRHFDVFRQSGTQGVSEVLGGGDETAEDKRLESVLNELPDQIDGLLQLGVFLSGERLGLAGHIEQAAAVGGRIGGQFADVAPGHHIGSLGSLILHKVQHGLAADLIDFLHIFGGEATAALVLSVAAAAAGLEASERSSARADHQRTR